MHQAFFEPTDAGLVPHPDARGPWSADMLHGRLLAGLAAWAVQREHGDAAFQPVRLTVDLYRSPAMAPTTVSTTLVRSGGRVRAADATIHVGGIDVARASALFLRRAERPGDEDAPQSAAWDAPPADELENVTLAGDAAFDVRPVPDRGFGSAAPGTRQVWLRDRRSLVAGDALSPFVRAALAADFASPLANSSPSGLRYINADLTVHLGRLPGGEWIGVETDDRVAADGASVSQCRLHDAGGPVGWSSVCAVLTPPMALPPDQ